jgi:hypothetical protein
MAAVAKAPSSALNKKKDQAQVVVWPVLAGPAGYTITTNPRQLTENITLPVYIPAAARAAAAAATNSKPCFVYILPPKELEAYRAAHRLHTSQLMLEGGTTTGGGSEPCQLEASFRAKEVPVEVMGRTRGEAWLTLVRINRNICSSSNSQSSANNVTLRVAGGTLLAVCRPLKRPPAYSHHSARVEGQQQAEEDLQVR